MSAFGNFLRSWDKYGQPISVNYKGEDAFRTPIGGLITILAYCLVIAYSVVKGEQLVSRANPNVTSTTEYINYMVDSEKYNLAG